MAKSKIERIEGIPLVPRSEWGSHVDHEKAVEKISHHLLNNGNSIPTVITPEHMGDATGYTSPDRKTAYGWFIGDTERTVFESVTLGQSIFINRRASYLSVENHNHLLGASFHLDKKDSRYIPFVGPGQGVEPALVRDRAGYTYYIRNHGEKWESIFSPGPLNRSLVQIASWDDAARVWIGFGYWDDGRGKYTWSGLAGFEGEPYLLYAAQVLSAQLPPAVFVEWLCEHYKLPSYLTRHALACGFTPEKN